MNGMRCAQRYNNEATCRGKTTKQRAQPGQKRVEKQTRCKGEQHREKPCEKRMTLQKSAARKPRDHKTDAQQRVSMRMKMCGSSVAAKMGRCNAHDRSGKTNHSGAQQETEAENLVFDF